MGSYLKFLSGEDTWSDRPFKKDHFGHWRENDLMG